MKEDYLERIAAAAQKKQDPDDVFTSATGVVSVEKAHAASAAIAASVVENGEQDKDPYNGVAPAPAAIICVASAICCC